MIQFLFITLWILTHAKIMVKQHCCYKMRQISKQTIICSLNNDKLRFPLDLNRVCYPGGNYWYYFLGALSFQVKLMDNNWWLGACRWNLCMPNLQMKSWPYDSVPGVGFAKPISSVPLRSQFFTTDNTVVNCWKSLSYLTGVAAAELLWKWFGELNKYFCKIKFFLAEW